MPALGDGSSDDNNVNNSNNHGRGRRLAASISQAYPASTNGRHAAMIRMASVFVFIMILRNMMLTDYRSDEIDTLKASGLTEEQIEMYVPRTPSEKANLRKSQIAKTASEFVQMKEDIEMLKKEVELLKKQKDEKSDLNNDKNIAGESEGKNDVKDVDKAAKTVE